MQKIIKSEMLPSGDLFSILMGLNSFLSSPTSEQGCKNRWGGGNVGIAPGNCFVYEFT